MSSPSRHRRTERRKALPSVRPGERDRLRQELHDRNPNCHWCGSRVRIALVVRGRPNPDDMATLEHLVPECLGGGYRPDNMVLACMRCNSMRCHHPSMKEAMWVYIGSATERIAKLVALRKQKGLTPTQKWKLKGARRKLREYQTFAARVAEGPFTPAAS